MPQVSDGLAGLGRRYSPDDRDRAFPMRAAKSERTFRNWLVPGPVADQGSTSQCVAYSIEAWLRAHPIVNAHTPESRIDRVALYNEAQLVDEWEGEYDGTSVRAGFKVLHRMGLVSSYRWAFDVGTTVHHLLSRGPVVVGTTWTLDMFMPDRHGYIRPTGRPMGGHAYLITGANTRRRNPDGTIGAVRMQNSWGPWWGPHKGRAWISLADMSVLIFDEGEVATADEVRVR